MITSKHLMTAGLLLTAAGVAVAAPGLRLSRVGTTPAAGQTGVETQIIGVVNDALPSGAIVGASARIEYDSAALGTLSAADLKYDAAKWSAISDFSTPGMAKISFTNITNDGMTATGPIATLTLHPAAGAKLKGGSLKLLGASDVTDFDYNTNPLGADVTTPVLPGTYRNLGGSISGAVSVGLGASDAKVIASVVTTGTASSLKLVDATTLADLGTGTVSGPTSGRPAFGTVDSTAVVAVGTDDGNLALFKATDASAVGSAIALGTKVSTPAIDNATGNIFAVAATSGGAPKLHLVKSGASAQSIDMEGTTVGADPAFVSGGVAAGSDTKLFMYRTDGSGPFVPQSSITGTGIKAPVIFGDGRGLVATDTGTVYQFDLTTGTVATSTVAAATGAAPFSPGFPVAGGAIFGGNDGSVYQFNLSATGPVAGTKTPLLTSPIISEPIALGSVIYAVDSTGNLKSSDGAADLNVGGAPTLALAATGAAAGGSIVAATTDGGVASMPF